MQELKIIIFVIAISIAIDITIKFIKWVNENKEANIKDFFKVALKETYNRYFIVWLLITIPIALIMK